MTTDERITAIEKEVAALKLALEERPISKEVQEYVTLPLESTVKFSYGADCFGKCQNYKSL